MVPTYIMALALLAHVNLEASTLRGVMMSRQSTMNEEILKFKGWVFLLNALLSALFIWLAIKWLPLAIENNLSLDKVEDLYLLGLVVASFWLGVCEFGYNLMLYFPKGTALEIHDNAIRVCTIFGLKEIPREAVKGCKNPVHRMTRGPKSGLVIITVAPEYQVIGPYGFKINPQFHGASVHGENEQTIVKKIREWRKCKNC
ncbi:hypothetical protein TDB9533_04794 [Thalassocella blandensis]|nr:hypothetical protein TDB9533_04794 [Thalassocella blandensis]